MLHQSTNPPQVLPTMGRAAKPSASPLDIINADIQPIETDSGNDLLDALCYMKDENDIGGMIDLYDAFAATGEALMNAAACGHGRAEALLNSEGVRAWAKAYLIADFMKQVRPNFLQAERYAHTMFDAVYRMGGNLEEAAAVIAEIASWELERTVPTSMVRR